jgi:glycosyltransferase involved in cell wall biosynthesis
MMTLILSIVALVCAAIPAVIYFRNQRAYRPAPAGFWAATKQPSVSVLIPARNEERSIRAAVESVLANHGVRVEVLVMDDHSEDRTAEIVQRMGGGENGGYRTIRLLQAPSLPSGWNGKQHACARLAEAASHDWLVFMDADVRLEPDALARMVAFMEQNQCDLGSGIPRQVTRSFWEKLIIPQIHFLLLGFLPIRRARKRNKPAYGAGCGQLFIARRTAYEQSGGHASIRASRHDGIKLPRLFRRMGFKTDLFDATDLASCRMYRSGEQVWRGFMKNATEGLGAPKIIVPFSTLLVAGQVLPFFLVWKECDSRMFSLLAIALAYYPRLAAVSRFRQPVLGALLHPLGVLAVLAIQWTALSRQVLGLGTEWKGRSNVAPKQVSHGLPVLRKVVPLLVGMSLAAAVWVMADEGAMAKRVPAFKLSDQFDTAHAVTFPREKPFILTVADNAGSKQLDAWIEPLKKEFGHHVDFLGVANLTAVPGPLQGMIKGRFKKKMTYPVMLDWSGVVIHAVANEAGKANVYAVGTDGAVLVHETGVATAEKIDMVKNKLSAALLAAGDTELVDGLGEVAVVRNQPNQPSATPLEGSK